MTSPEPPERPAHVEPPSRRRRRRSVVWWLGVLMILAGLAMLGWVAWQMWGTNWVSEKEQRRITAELEQDWQAGQALSPKHVPTGDASALVRIPAFGKSYVIPVLEGTSEEVLAKGFGHFEDSADPGEVGNYAIAGHRVTHGEPLRRMPELRPGDKVIVETAEATYTYALDTDPNALIIPFTGVWVLDPLPDNPEPGGVEPAQKKGQRLISLTTCSELFHTDDRMIAFGHLVATDPKPGAEPAAKAGPVPEPADAQAGRG